MRWSAIVLLAVLAGCGGKHPGSYEAGSGAGDKTAADSKFQAAEAAWDERLNEAKLQEALKLYEEVVVADPSNRDALARLTRGWYLWGDAFTDDKTPKLERWAKAIEWGTRCLALNTEFTSQLQGGAKEKDAVSALKKEDVPCTYWTATALGKWGKAQSLSTTLKHLPTVKAYIGKVEELEPTFFYYGPARYWGAYYAALPSFAGKDLEKSKQYFAASIQGEPNYLATRVLRAELYAVEAGDARMFKEDLEHVIAADPKALPGAFAENSKEQEKAKKLLAKGGELFYDFDATPSGGTGPAPTTPSGGTTTPSTPAGDASPSGGTTPSGGGTSPSGGETPPTSPSGGSNP